MPRFAANLGHLFTDRPLHRALWRCRGGGFQARSNCNFPMTLAPAAVKAELETAWPDAARHQHAAMSGIRSCRVARTRRDFDAAFKRALDYVVAIGGTAIHCMAGVVPVEQRPAAEMVFIKNLSRAAAEAAKANITLLIEPINPRDRPDYFLSRVEHAADICRQDRRAECAHPVRFLSHPDRRRRSDQALREILPVIGHVQIAAVPTRGEPDEGEINYPAIFEAIDRLGYAGWIGCEYKPRKRTEDGLGWAKPYGVVPKRS